MYKKRSIEQTILELGNSFPCIVVYGPRQVGKSTTLDYIFPESINRVTLDDLADWESLIFCSRTWRTPHTGL